MSAIEAVVSGKETGASERPPGMSWYWNVLLLALLAAMAFLLRVYALDRADIDIDEDLNISAVEQPLTSVPGFVAPRPPMTFIAQKLTGMMLGRADALAIRFASVLEGVAAVLLFWHVLRRMAGTTTAWLGTILLAFSHYHLVFCREGRYYSLLVFSILVFLWGYWEVFHERRWRFFAVLCLGAALSAGTHQSGLLFIAICFAASPLFLVSPEWLYLVRKQPRMFAVAGIGVLLAAVVGLFVFRNHVSAMLAIALKGLNSNEMTSSFDVSPGFLFKQFSDYSGLESPIAYWGAILFAAGLLSMSAKRPRLAGLVACIIVGPFLLTFLLKPHSNTVWRNRYFIFVMPMILFVEAMGIEATATLMVTLYRRCLKREAGRFFHMAFLIVLAGTLVAANLWAIGGEYRKEDRSMQETAAFLDAAAKPGEDIVCTQWYPKYTRKDLNSTWDMRVAFRRYFRPEAGLNATRLATTLDALGIGLDTASCRWYLHAGSWTTSPEIAEALFSSTLSRMPIGKLWVAHGPGLQGMDFGKNAAGTPDSAGPLCIAPGQETTLDLLCPREGERVCVGVFLEKGLPASEPLATASQGEHWSTLALEGKRCAGRMRLPRGRIPLTVKNTDSSHEMAFESLCLLPELGDAPVEIPAWDFRTIRYGYNMQSIYLEPSNEGTLVRGVRSTPRIYYGVYSAKPGKARIRLDAVSDAPFPNVYEIGLPAATRRLFTLTFDESDNKVHTRETEAVPIVKGMNTLYIRPMSVDKKTVEKMQGPLHVVTSERLQTNGMRSITITPITP